MLFCSFCTKKNAWQESFWSGFCSSCSSLQHETSALERNTPTTQNSCRCNSYFGELFLLWKPLAERTSCPTNIHFLSGSCWSQEEANISNSHCFSRVSPSHSRSKFISVTHLHGYFHWLDHELDSPIYTLLLLGRPLKSRMEQTTYRESFPDSQRRPG